VTEACEQQFSCTHRLSIGRRCFRLGHVLIGVLALFIGFGKSVAADREVVLSTLEWPPFASSQLADFGATSKIIIQAFANQGYDVRLSFNPWAETVDMARKGVDGVIAYYPGYHCRHRENFIASDPIGSSPLGFAERVDAPIEWQTLDDLGEQAVKIGTVFGYTNTDEFDKKVGIGWIRAIPSDDDTENLKKLLRRRIDAAVIDQHVFRYLVATDGSLKEGKGLLQFDERLLSDARFFLCFRDDADGVRLKQDFNAGLKSVDIDRTISEYMDALTELQQ